MSFVPDRAGFLELARHGRLAFVYREVLADTDTPVSAYAKLGRGPYSFLLESVVGGDKWAAYSFVGVRPRAVVRARGRTVEVLAPDSGDRGDPAGFRVVERVDAAEPLRFLDDYLGKLAPAVPAGLPRFFGGAVGWLGYDIVRSFERLPGKNPDDLGLPELCFAITDTVVIFDNLRGTVKVVAAADVGQSGSTDAAALDHAYDDACARIEAVLDRLARPAPPLRALDPAPPATPPEPRATITREAYEAGVRRVQEYILAGDAFQVVYSQRFEVPRGGVVPFDVYRALRVINPSPYMFHLEFPEAVVTGASPEVLVRLEAGEVEVRPIAGTRRRGVTAEEDAALEAELRADPKERAEHVMLIDLGRNDVGRVSVPGTVGVQDLMVVERYSHVMHLVSNVRGRHPVRSAQGPGHGDHRGARDLAPRDLRRRGRVPVVHREHGPLDRHPDAGYEGGHHPRPGGRWDRRRQRPGRRVPRVREQGRRRGERRRDRAPRVGARRRSSVGAQRRARGALAVLLIIDNYDSFTYNLVQYFGELGQVVRVVRNDEIPAADIAALGPSHIVISPGPCTPNEAGISLDVIKTYAGRIPILGVCLGHQAIGQAFGGRVVRAARVMHGKTSKIFHDEKGVFFGLPNPFEATRYHSLLIERATVPDALDVTAKTWDEEIMAVRHKTLPVEGVQFHPESFLTTAGKELLRNFLARKGRP